MSQKFIIHFKEETVYKVPVAILADVGYHDDLRRLGMKEIPNSSVNGGGWYHLENDVLYLYGISTDYGSYEAKNTVDVIVKAILNSTFWNKDCYKAIKMCDKCYSKNEFEKRKEFSETIYGNLNYVNSSRRFIDRFKVNEKETKKPSFLTKLLWKLKLKNR